MSRDVLELLRDTTDAPTRPVDAPTVVTRARRRARHHRVLLAASAAVPVLVALLVVPFLTGDRGERVPSIIDEPPPLVASPIHERLIGRTFVAIEIVRDGEPHRLIEGTQLSLSFDEPRTVFDSESVPEARRHEAPVIPTDAVISWSAGCSTLMMDARLDNGHIDAITLPTPPYVIDGPLQPCPDQDRWIADFLSQAAPRWELDGDRLTLTSDDTTIVLIATAPAEPTSMPEQLIGRRFVSVEIVRDGEPHQFVDDTNLTISFREPSPVNSDPSHPDARLHEEADARIGWSAGCNFHSALLRLHRGLAEYLPGGSSSTQMYCGPERDAQESWIGSFLSHANTRWELDGDRLTLTSDDTTIVLVATTATPPGPGPGTTAEPQPDVPTTSSTLDPGARQLIGRRFVSIEVTRDGQPYELDSGALDTNHLSIWFVTPHPSRPDDTSHLDANLALLWNSGCNNHDAQLRLRDGVVEWTRGGGSTEMGCSDGQFEDERWIEEFLLSLGTRWESDGDRLTVTNDDTTVVMVAAPTAEPFPLHQHLIGSTYVTVEVIRDGEPHQLVGGSELSIVFREPSPVTGDPSHPDARIHEEADVNISWYSGCNGVGMLARLADERLRSVTIPYTDAMACSPEHEAQDAWITDFLARANPHWRLDNQQLVLVIDDTAIVLEPTSDPPPD